MADVYCWDGCGRPATTERLHSMAGEDEVVVLVCAVHARDDVLYCGHPDDDTAVFHHSEDHGGPVCSDCCPECNNG